MSDFFQPLQLGVACKSVAEIDVRSVRKCIEDNWLSEDFVLFKVDMSIAFSRVSRQVVLMFGTFSPELLLWVSWCYGSHTLSIGQD